ncbi:MAG: O-antigen ligase family protein [Hyphomicrobiales bacterium]|nr:O-antigen ligase family protein [Hyphomicrobiales bacterium]
MNHLIALALLSLFTAFKVKTGLVQLRPFDGLVAVMFLLTLLGGHRRMQFRLTAGLLILLPYFFWHMFSATTVGLENGLREGLQIAVVTAFALTLAAQADRIDHAKLGRLMLVGLLLITAYNIYWHVDHGFWTGWKRLLDPKRAFNFLPLVLGCLLLCSGGQTRRLYWLLWAGLGVVILFSGERKALAIYLILSAALAARGRLLITVPAMAAGIVLVGLFGSMIDNPYLQRQVRTILDPLGSTLSLSAIAAGEMPESMSNAQRKFAATVSMELFTRHPIIGVGTNAYRDTIEARYAYLPEFMRLSPHGEILRILVENGLVGLMLYLSIWGIALTRLLRVLMTAARAWIISREQAVLLPVILFVPTFFYLSLEAAGTHSLVALVIISLSPEFCVFALRNRMQRAVTATTPIYGHLRSALGRSASAR